MANNRIKPPIINSNKKLEKREIEINFRLENKVKSSSKLKKNDERFTKSKKKKTDSELVKFRDTNSWPKKKKNSKVKAKKKNKERGIKFGWVSLKTDNLMFSIIKTNKNKIAVAPT